MATNLSAADWIKGISLSILATVFGAASKLAIRKSWLMEAKLQNDDDNSNNSSSNENGNDNSFETIHEYPDLRLPEDVARDESRIRRTAKYYRYSGMVGMTVLNPLAGVWAMAYASPSITAPFSGMTLVWVVLFSHPFIGEVPTVRQVVAAFLIIVGEIVVAIFGDHTNSDESETASELLQSYLEPAFVAYFIAIALWMLFLAFCIHCSNSQLLQRFAWGVSGGSITGMQNFLKDALIVLKKTSATTITSSEAGDNDSPSKSIRKFQIPSWHFFVLAAIAIAVAVVGLLLLTWCMKRYDAAFSSSMFVGSYVVSTSLMSAAHYHTFQHLHGRLLNDIGYPAGLLILMAGVGLLVRQTNHNDDNAGRNPRRLKRKQSYQMVPRRRLDS